MAEPSLSLQGALVATLKADPAVNALLAGRIYDRVPTPPTFPYVTLGDDQIIGDGADCLNGSVEIFAILHVFSRAVGKPEAKRISGAIVAAVNGTALNLHPDYVLNLIQHDSTRHLDDPDGLTSHSVVTFHALIDEA